MSTIGTNGQSRFERHPVITGVVIALLLVTVLDLLLGSVRWTAYKRMMLTGMAVEESYRVPNARYHHDLAPLAHRDSALWGEAIYRIRTNSQGFKDASTRVIDTLSRAPRVLLLGDSFTEGVGVPFDSTFAGALAARGRLAGVEILNAAVASYAPAVYWRKAVDIIDRRRLHIDEVVVFIDISDIEDEVFYQIKDDSAIVTHAVAGLPQPDRQPSTDFLEPKSVRAWVAAHSLVLYGAGSRVKKAFAALAHGSILPPRCLPPPLASTLECRGGWTSSPEIMHVYGDSGLAAAQKHMSMLAAFLRSRDIPLTIVVYPWKYQLAWNDRHSLQSATWRRWAANERTRFIDLFPPFFALADSGGFAFATGALTIPGDVHWNARGHAFVEQEFRQRYCASGVTPGAALARGICAAAR